MGGGAGSGYGLLMLIAGALLVITTGLVYAVPRVRHVESEMPDYVPEVFAETADTPIIEPNSSRTVPSVAALE